MAMRPRMGRTSQGPPQAAVRPLYEDVKPTSEWKQEEKTDILLVYLPGFVKDQIKVTTERPNILRVRGERPVAGNKWSRFREDFHIPEATDTSGIRAKFENGSLMVTMPRKSIQQDASKAEAKTTQKDPRPQAQDSIGKPMPQKVQEDIQTKTIPPMPQKVQEDIPTRTTQPMPRKIQEDLPTRTTQPTPWKVQEDLQTRTTRPMPDKVPRDNPPKVTPTDEKTGAAAPSPQKLRSDLNSQRTEEEMPPKETSSIKPTNADKMSTPNATEETEISQTKDKPTKQLKMQEDGLGKALENDRGSSKQSEISDKAEILGAENVASEKEKSVKTVDGGERKDNDYLDDGKAKESTKKVDNNYSQAVKRLADGANEERQLMVNMGAAVLLIVALGAYISYNLGSSGNANN